MLLPFFWVCDGVLLSWSGGFGWFWLLLLGSWSIALLGLAQSDNVLTSAWSPWPTWSPHIGLAQNNGPPENHRCFGEHPKPSKTWFLVPKNQVFWS